MKDKIGERFVRRLEKLTAAQRVALKGEAGRMLQPDVAAFDAFTAAFWPLRDTGLPRDVCRLVAGLYFWHPKEGGTENLGAAFRQAARRGRAVWAERLLRRLLAAPLAGLRVPLFEAVRQLAAARIPVDWAGLILDLRNWDRDLRNWDRGGERSVQQNWAESWLQRGDCHAD